MTTKKICFLIAFLAFLTGISAQTAVKQKGKSEKVYYVKIETSYGDMVVKLYNETPKHRDNFLKLVKEGTYNDLLFHRVINKFMIQGGDPKSRNAKPGQMLGDGELGYTIPAEFVPTLYHKKGALAAARQGDEVNPQKASSSCQFYIVQDPDNCVHLDGEYTVFGETVAGLNVIDKIASVKRDRYDRPINDVRIIKITPDDELNKIERH